MCRFAALAAAAVVAGCSPAAGEFGFVIDSLSAQWRGDSLVVSARQSLTLSDEARQALVHGVPLTIDVQVEYGAPGGEPREHTSRFEIRYLPLSDHYRMARSDGRQVRTYPRLRHVLSQLGNVKVELDVDESARPEIDLRLRSTLNLRKVPAPMRLPVLFSGEWKHDSGWRHLSIESPPASGA